MSNDTNAEKKAYLEMLIRQFSDEECAAIIKFVKAISEVRNSYDGEAGVA